MVRKTVYIIIIFLLIISLPSTLAVKAFHEDWHYPGETFTIDGKLYSVSQGSDCYQINFGREGEYFILNEFDCKETIDRVEKFCFLESACPDDDDHIKYEAGNIIYGAKLALYDLVPKVSVTNVASVKTVRLGDELEFTTTITNEGEMAVSDGLFKIRIPEGFDLVNKPSTASFKNGLLTKKFSIGPGFNDVFKYKLKVKDYLSEVMFANVSYYYNEEEYEYSSEKTTINVPSPYLITRSLSKKTVGVNEESIYKFTFENNDGQEDINLNVHLEGADKLKIVYPKEFRGGVLTKTFSPGDKETYDLILSSKYTSVNNLELVFDMVLQGETITKNYQNVLTAQIPAIQPTISMKSEINEKADYDVRVKLKNPSTQNGFHNVKGYIMNQQTKEKHSFNTELIGKNYEELVLDFVTTSPDVDEETIHEYLLKGTYESISGEEFEFSKTAKIKTLNKKEPFTLTRQLNDTDLKAGDLVEVNVKLKNQLGKYAPLVINDVLPDSVFVKAGLRSTEMSVDIGQEEQVYIYKLLIPETYPDNELTIITKVYDKNSGEVYEFENNYEVTPHIAPVKEPEEPIVVNDSETVEEPLVREKKKGLFQKIVDGVSNFFESLFG